jgi:hypothetical protein
MSEEVKPPKEDWRTVENGGLWIDTALFIPECYRPMAEGLIKSTQDKHAGNLASQLVVRYCYTFHAMKALIDERGDVYDSLAGELLEMGGRNELLLLEGFRRAFRDGLIEVPNE